jgi:hypothetical protein
MERWRDVVIEKLLPSQVAALDAQGTSFTSKSSNRPFTRESILSRNNLNNTSNNINVSKELLEKRSFARAMSGRLNSARSRSDWESQSEAKAPEPEIPFNKEQNRSMTAASIYRRLNEPLIIGFPVLESLILEGNKLHQDNFHILSFLPK